MTLNEVGLKNYWGKDHHIHYANLYESHIDRTKILNVLELGILEGGSLLTWIEWFFKATVVGVDNNQLCSNIIDHPRCKIVIADQCDPSLISLGNFDLIIDDASHDPVKQYESLRLLWSSLNSGGWYVIEDLETSYNEEAWNDPTCVIPNLKSLIDRLTADYSRQRSDRFPRLSGLRGIHWYSNIVFLEKSK